MQTSKLSDADRAIVTALAEQGNLTKGALVDETEYSRNTVYTRLEVLQAAGVVECVHEPTRLFTLAGDPSDELQGPPFERTRRMFNRLDRDEVEAFVTAVAVEGDGITIQLDATRGNGGIAKQLTLQAVYLRALASVLDAPIEDVLQRCGEMATDIQFDGKPNRGTAVLEEPG